ncbi:MAG: bifunctional diaminohydroxyphosphoribosylaminopyrimidine deaminase/5-amino-6-(5-phosphoribosylamino)uracil reductase RibD, partial [Deltaproteobacteria bacterium]|nr:bifunctional diaminohydroxyphosphoribosylaminopyrimidine deaminase/5-amino-6-(5-phosphoribosylamino)uracil reductase RibD [Deltaproteobacteria bacterium]
GRVVGQGWHRRAGEPHAEAIALRVAGEAARGATLYCTLEPCSFVGRTPACASAVVESGVARLVLGSTDPDARVRGRGIARIRRAGIEVTTGVESEASEVLLRFYRKHRTVGMPWVRLKLGASLDGRIATTTGASRWITGPEAREMVHRWRDELDAIVVGVGTVLADDPSLTCRRVGGRDPIRVVVDGRLRTPPAAKLFREGEAPVWIATTRDAPAARARRLEESGATIVRVSARQGKVDLRSLLRALGKRGLTSALVEGGARLGADLVARRLVDEICVFTAPLLIGGDGIPMIGSIGARSLPEAVRLREVRVTPVGADYLWRARLDGG